MISINDLPANSLVKSEEKGLWLKDENGLWYELMAHCGECAETASEEGTTTPTKYQPGITVSTPAAEYLGKVEILAVPPGFALEGN